MPTTQRRAVPGVIDQLLTQPQRFTFCHAVWLIDTLLRQHGIEHDVVLRDHLRFGNRLSFSFPPSEIDTLTAYAGEPIANAAALGVALASGGFSHIQITPVFLSLLGSTGILPNHISERIAEHEHATKDVGARAFLDIFTNVTAALFYRAWKKHRVECMEDEAGNPACLMMLRAFAGHAPRRLIRAWPVAAAPSLAALHPVEPARLAAPLSDDAIFPDEVAAFYATQFRGRTLPAVMLAGVLSSYFAVPISVDALLGGWDELPIDQQAVLGVSNMDLSKGILPGNRIYRRNARARVRLGPLARDDFERFLPHARAAQALGKLLGMFTGKPLIYEIRLILRASDVHPLSSDGSSRLGIDAFLLSGPSEIDRDDYFYHLQP